MCAVPNMAVFYSSSISYFPGMLLRYCLRDNEIVPVSPIITGITFAVIFHIR
jgi:glycerol-3-phosphate O-acyltransferase